VVVVVVATEGEEHAQLKAVLCSVSTRKGSGSNSSSSSVSSSSSSRSATKMGLAKALLTSLLPP